MLVVIQSAAFCNIDCSYCYLPGRTSKSRIRLATLEKLASGLAQWLRPGSNLEVAWHAGEPFVLPIEFYRDAFTVFSTLRKRGINLTHIFQTNGTLITDDWIQFLGDEGPSLGLSIDGPKDLHDRHRRYRSGAGSWVRVMAGIQRLQRAQIPFHTISVLTKDALQQPDRMFDFFQDYALHDIAFNIEEIEGVHTDSDLIGDEAYRLCYSFFSTFLGRNRAAGFPLHIREAEVVASALSRNSIELNAQVVAGEIISVDTTGNVATFSPELLGQHSEQFTDFVIGNVWDHTILEMLRSPVARAMATDIAAGTAMCEQTCDLFRFCRGGCPANKLGEAGTFIIAETRHCRLTVKAIMAACLDEMISAGSLDERMIEET
jgi:uncharacterized protein